MAEVFFTPHLKCDPARIRNPVMLFGEIVCQQGIVDRTREGYVNDSIRMDVPDLSISEPKLHSGKAMWMNRNVPPPRHFLFEFLQVKSHD
jgi:hypothetical protein